MTAVDTNILVYAHRRQCPEHDRALTVLRQLAEGKAAWCIAWPCIYEFVRVVTHSQVFKPPSSMKEAVGFVDTVVASPSLLMLGDSAEHWGSARKLLLDGDATGNLVFDAHIAAILSEHGVTLLYTRDRDFRRFRGIEVVDPFAEET